MGVPEKTDGDAIDPVARQSNSIEVGKVDDNNNAFEVFKKEEGAVDFRTVGWVSASVIFLKGMSPDGDDDDNDSITRRKPTPSFPNRGTPLDKGAATQLTD